VGDDHGTPSGHGQFQNHVVIRIFQNWTPPKVYLLQVRRAWEELQEARRCFGRYSRWNVLRARERLLLFDVQRYRQAGLKRRGRNELEQRKARPLSRPRGGHQDTRVDHDSDGRHHRVNVRCRNGRGGIHDGPSHPYELTPGPEGRVRTSRRRPARQKWTGGPCFAYILKLNVCQRRRRSHWPTVRLPTWMRAVPRMPGVSTACVSSSDIIAS